MPAKARLSSSRRGYDARHKRIRAEFAKRVAAGGVLCVRCGDPIHPREAWDLGHVDGDRSRYSGPEHAFCNRSAAEGGHARPMPVPVVEVRPEPDGLAASDERWDVPWLRKLRRVPADATWPRLMTVPHPAAAGSLGAEFVRWAEKRSGGRLRWWQKLAATRLLEVDDDGELVWETMLLTIARQLGKSWLLREVLLWRIHQGDRFGESQTVIHTGKDLDICNDVQRLARNWARERPDIYKVREVNGRQTIEYLPTDSRWIVRSKESVYGFTASLAAADEAWKVPAAAVDEGLTPTMVERVQPQLLLVSTAHRLATSLMLERRRAALADLELGDGDLLIEWSAPAAAALEDVEGWRLASPHWTPQRERQIGRELRGLLSGEIRNPDEPDPEESFRAQWLNQWPRKLSEPAGNTEDLLEPGLWAELADEGLEVVGGLFVAVEDYFGHGAAVAAAGRLEDGRIEVDGWRCDDWDSAIASVRLLQLRHRIRELRVGASLMDRVPPDLAAVPAGTAETRHGLALFRDLADGRMLAHELTGELDQAVAVARVKELSTGLQLAPVGPTDLIKAAVWAVASAHRPAPIGAIH